MNNNKIRHIFNRNKKFILKSLYRNANLFLDDIRYPETSQTLIDKDHDLYKDDGKWVIVRTYNEFCDFITEYGVPGYVSFDHDLADYENGEEKTGYDCSKWLIDYCLDNDLDIPRYQVHSANTVGKKNITCYIENAKKYR